MIERLNTLGKDQPEHLTLRDRNGQLIGEIDLTGVDGESNETPHKIENFEETYLDQSDAVDKELAYQPPDEDQHQKADFRDNPKTDLAAEIQEDPQETILVYQ